MTFPALTWDIIKSFESQLLLFALVHITDDNVTTILAAEYADLTAGPTLPASYVQADQFVFRFNPPETQYAILYAQSFGKPLAGVNITFAVDTSSTIGDGVPSTGLPNPTTGKIPLSFPNAIPVAGLPGLYRVTTDSNGVANISIFATDPGNSRGYIDGQLFGIMYRIGNELPSQPVFPPNQYLSLLDFDEYVIPEKPTWIADVAPIFLQ